MSHQCSKGRCYGWRPKASWENQGERASSVRASSITRTVCTLRLDALYQPRQRQHLQSYTANQACSFFEPPRVEDEDVKFSRPRKPRIATDTSLTSFAQLAALRLNCQRCFISLIDDKTQYVVAEATRTIGLESEDIFEDENDRLSFGQTMLDFKTGVCPGTIACFSSLDSSLDISSSHVQASKNCKCLEQFSNFWRQLRMLTLLRMQTISWTTCRS